MPYLFIQLSTSAQVYPSYKPCYHHDHVLHRSEHGAGDHQVVLKGRVDRPEGRGEEEHLLHLVPDLLGGLPPGQHALGAPHPVLGPGPGLRLGPDLAQQLLLPVLHHTEQVTQPLSLGLQRLQLQPRPQALKLAWKIFNKTTNASIFL